MDRVRDMVTFGSKDELTAQIGRDVEVCKEIYGSSEEALSENIYLSQDFTPEVIRLV